jgi:hypothetical protein
MYDKDLNFGEHFSDGDRFVVLAASYDGEIRTSYGLAKKTTFTIATRDKPERTRYMALGAGFAAQAMRAEPSDFPHVAELVREKRGDDREVKLLVPVSVEPAEFMQGNDGPPTPESVAQTFDATEVPVAGSDKLPWE